MIHVWQMHPVLHLWVLGIWTYLVGFVSSGWIWHNEVKTKESALHFARAERAMLKADLDLCKAQLELRESELEVCEAKRKYPYRRYSKAE